MYNYIISHYTPNNGQSVKGFVNEESARNELAKMLRCEREQEPRPTLEWWNQSHVKAFLNVYDGTRIELITLNGTWQ